LRAVEGAMVLIQLLLPTSGTPSAEAGRRSLRHDENWRTDLGQETIDVRAVPVDMLDGGNQ